MADLRYVASISWPRSGHHLLVRLLRRYFGEGRFNYCEYYEPLDCCKKFPCQKGGVHLSKNHDHDRKLPTDADVPYLIQIRDFLPALVSNFDLFVRNGNPDTRDAFWHFGKNQAKRYRHFEEKWVRSALGDRLILRYEDVVGDPVDAVGQAIRHIAPGEDIDSEVLEKTVDSAAAVEGTISGDIVHSGRGVQATRNIEEFRHYDAVVFEELSRLVE